MFLPSSGKQKSSNSDDGCGIGLDGYNDGHPLAVKIVPFNLVPPAALRKSGRLPLLPVSAHLKEILQREAAPSQFFGKLLSVSESGTALFIKRGNNALTKALLRERFWRLV